jgi:hypothetical protein
MSPHIPANGGTQIINYKPVQQRRPLIWAPAFAGVSGLNESET